MSEARLLVLRLMEGLPDTGSHPAQMGIGSAIIKEFLEEIVWSVCRK